MPADNRIRDAFRRWGYLQAELDPFGRLQPLVHADLEGLDPKQAAPWRRAYAGPIGVEFMHIPDAARVEWLAGQMESEPAEPDRRRILDRLAEAELFERYVHRRWVGTKRYSLEGSAALMPLLDALLDEAAAAGAGRSLIAMSHRGRLNVMMHIVRRPARDLFALFEDTDARRALGGGDVRYHLGATGVFKTGSGHQVEVHLVSNPSHLEAVNPVLMGRARAWQDRLQDADGTRVLPVCLHGDGAFAGQGIAAETLNLDGLRGFSVGGTVQVVVNNLIGFTAEPRALHGSRYATDVARRLAIPIFHVNGLDPEAVVRVARMAAAYRARFHSDVVIDLIGFRRYGHSEVDDPTATQPLLYRRLADEPLLWRTYGEALGMSGGELDAMERGIGSCLDEAREMAAEVKQRPSFRTLPDYWDDYQGGPWQPDKEIKTGVEAGSLAALGERLTSVPQGFALHDKVSKALQQRLRMARGEEPVDWGAAEALAFASLLREGVPVRLAGEDSRRGTFNQRHAVLIDQESGEGHMPLAHLAAGQAPVSVYDTALSEAAALGFEYGYSRDCPEALVCWEAQFGDFANGAQVIIDQFISAGEDKWDLCSGIVMLLPHGFEGQGPEHSSARLERFLQLCAEDNMQVCQPTTAAQYFHLLRRQALRAWRKPLVVMMPKGLLRAPVAASPLAELAGGRFMRALPDPEVTAGARRLLVCTGRLAYDLRARREQEKRDDVAVLTLEQLYPFPERDLEAALAPYREVREIIWVQEEPANMGAEFFVRPRLQRLLGDRHVKTLHRSASASPATGSPMAHKLEQESLLRLAFARLG